MVRIEKVRGKTEAEMKALTLEQALPLFTSRARRAVKRAANKSIEFKKFIKKVAKWQKAGKGEKPIKTQIREAVILPDWIGLTFAVHAGKEWKPVKITFDKVGYRLGDFAHTTGRVLHSGPGVGATRGSKFIPLK